MARADGPSTVPGRQSGDLGAPGLHARSGMPAEDPAVLDLAALEEQALGVLSPAVADYYAGGAEAEITLGEATAAWRSWRLRPRVLRAVPAVRLATSLLGSEVRTPVGIAPWAYQSLAHPDGERGSARGAAAAGALLTVSTSASTPPAEVAATEPQSRSGSSSIAGTPPPTPTTSRGGPARSGTGRWCSRSTCRSWDGGCATWPTA
jgi:4-hydroxymandelate oxidase